MKAMLLVSGLFLALDSTESVGGDKDEFGCIASAGYTWCEKLGSCARSWELEGSWDEVCNSTISTGSPLEEESQENSISSDTINSSSEDAPMSSSENGSGSKDEFSSERASSEESDASNSHDGEDKQAADRVWFYEFLAVAISLCICVPMCVFLVERKRMQDRRRAVMVQMLNDDGNKINALDYVETVAVKETEMISGVSYDRFNNTV